MNQKNAQSLVNDYLDLYLYAGSIGDCEWQQEIMARLHELYNGKDSLMDNQTYTREDLWQIFNGMNQEILTLYKQLRSQPGNRFLREKVWELKAKRQSLTRQLSTVAKIQ
ncbi:hypothetical protein ACQCN2_21555 [Brevibacillus ginsengisoli]|uniref:hypothetical protein n=1 Tax=Brevibacillus ginsengisoli TaxID=363854 RepID=UPI003CE8DBE6